MTFSADQITKARNVDLLSLIGNDTTLSGNAEKFGPCPFCGGTDRFHVKDNAWFCSYCTGRPEAGKPWSDPIDYIMKRNNVDFSGAVTYLTGDRPAVELSRPVIKPKDNTMELSEFSDKAKAIMLDLCDDLWVNRKALDWLAQRGIDMDSAVRHSLGYTDGGEVGGLWFGLASSAERGIVFPHIWTDYKLGKNIIYALKVRRPVTGGTPNKYYCAKGSLPSISLFNANSLHGQDYCFITEGETDALCLYERVKDFAAVITTGAASTRLHASWLPALMPVKRFFIVTDTDEAGHKASKEWQALLGERAERVYAPGNHNDICDAYMDGENIRNWAALCLPSMVQLPIKVEKQTQPFLYE